MGWLHVLIPVIAAVFYWKSDHVVLFGLCMLAAVGAFWSWGVLHNYAIEAAKHRPGFSGGFNDITDKEAEGAPDWITRINMGFAVLGTILLVAALLMWLLGRPAAS